jgi:hypothetical protein
MIICMSTGGEGLTYILRDLHICRPPRAPQPFDERRCESHMIGRKLSQYRTDRSRANGCPQRFALAGCRDRADNGLPVSARRARPVPLDAIVRRLDGIVKLILKSRRPRDGGLGENY